MVKESESRLRLMKVLSPRKTKLIRCLLCFVRWEAARHCVLQPPRCSADRVGALLAERDFTTRCFGGGVEQPDREKALYKFRNGSCHVLVSTDLAARGLDIPEVEHIIHYHLPVNEEAFTPSQRTNSSLGCQRNVLYHSACRRGLSDLCARKTRRCNHQPDNPARPPQPLWATYIGKGKRISWTKLILWVSFIKGEFRQRKMWAAWMWKSIMLFRGSASQQNKSNCLPWFGEKNKGNEDSNWRSKIIARCCAITLIIICFVCFVLMTKTALRSSFLCKTLFGSIFLINMSVRYIFLICIFMCLFLYNSHIQFVIRVSFVLINSSFMHSIEFTID